MHKDIEMLFNLSGQVALVTGGSKNLGFDAASVLAAAGCHVAMTSRQLSNAQNAAGKIKDTYDVDVLPVEMEQTNFESVSQAVQNVGSWKGRLDILVNNAGGGSGAGSTRLFERPAEDIARLIETNLTGVMYCCKAAGKIMQQQGNGKIINIASVAGLVGRDRRMYERNGMSGQAIDYAAAKAGVIGLTYDLAAMLGPKGVYVNAISPGGFNRELPEGFVRDYSDRTPLGRMGRDGVDLNGAVLFLASAASDYITGHNLVVDGGFSIWQ